MSIQLGILLILASHPDGSASVPSINADMRLLSGRDWSRKLRELSRRTGPVSIFKDGLVERDAYGWRITAAGRTFVASLDAMVLEEPGPPPLRLVSSQPVPALPTAASPRRIGAKAATAS